MTFLNESRSNKGLGYLLLQHHQSSDPSKNPVGDQGYGKDGRHCLMGGRVFGRMIPNRLGGNEQHDDGFVGPYIADGKAFGDIIGSFLWNHSTDKADSGNPNGPTGDRGFPAWRWSWPVIKRRQKTYYTRSPEQQPPPAYNIGSIAEDFEDCPELREHMWQPLKEGGDPDIDFALKELGSPFFPDMKFPVGHIGLGMSGTNEWEQDETYLPTDPRLLAVNSVSDVRMATQVCDVNESFTIDPVKRARLHSFLRVVDNGPFCEDLGEICGDPDQKTLAWNITLSGCEDTYGGWVHDRYTGVTAAVESKLNGPFFTGTQQDKHALQGEDALPVNPLHIHLGAYFTDSGGYMDGPKHHNGHWKGSEQNPHSSYVWLEYDGADEGKEPDAPRYLGHHPFVCKKKDGMDGWHRWRAESSRCDSGVPPHRPGYTTGHITTTPPPPPPPPPERPDGDHGHIYVEWNIDDRPPPPWDVGDDEEALDGLDFIVPVHQDHSGEERNLHYQMSTMEDSVPSFVFRPPHVATGSVDYRNWRSPTDEAVNDYKKYTPAVGRLEAFGHQDAGEHKGKFCPGWAYTADTNEPDGHFNGRYHCKTADGGVMFMPPEYGLENYAGVSGDPSTSSTSTFLMAPSTKLAFGLPDLTTGKLSTTAHEDANGGFSIYVHTDGTLRVDTADGVNALYIKESGNVVITGPIDSVPSITSSGKGSFGGTTAATGGVKGLEVEATNKVKGGYLESAGSIAATTVVTVGSATALTPPSNLVEALAFNGAGNTGTVGGLSSGQSFLYTKDEGYGVLGLYYKNYYGETKIN